MGLAHNTLDDILSLGGTILLGLPDGEETWDIDR
jgi:hypothetical protein